jgi:kumamolisin
MATNTRYVPIRGSEREPLPGARVIGPTPPDERLEVTVRVRRRAAPPSIEEMARQLPGDRRYLTREEYETTYGADPKDLDAVAAFAQQHGLAVVEANRSRRSVILSGTADAFSKAFQVTLNTYAHAQGTYRGRTGAVQVPAELAGVVEGVFGLDNRPFARPHLSRRTGEGAPAAASRTTFTSPQIAQLYNFPPGVDGTGQCIGILELGGGYRPADLTAYFQQLGLQPPAVTPISVDHAHNHPVGSVNSADGEVVLDIEVAGGVAPGARLAVYFAPNRTDQNFLDALTTAIHDNVNKPSVISISWGGPETAASQSFMQQFDAALHAAALLGITVCCAAGDDGAADMLANQWDGRAHTDYPASSAFALACGGTRLQAASGALTGETVWNQHGVDPTTQSFGATGGGVSDFTPLPSWQETANIPTSVNPGGRVGRGVPDVAGVADPATGYNILVDGHFEQGFGGTSAVAPLWAGLIALINQSLGTPVGFVNALLYGPVNAAGAFHDITGGDNQVGNANIGYAAGPEWDACTGLGTPDGQKLLNALRGQPGGGP